MSPVHFHLISVHLPIVAIPLFLILLLFGMKLDKRDLKNTALIGFVIIALLTIPVYLSGEAAEEAIEHLAGISEDDIEHHEEAATLAFISVLITGALSLVTLIVSKTKASLIKPALLLTVIASIISTGTLARAGNDGGKIKHQEIHDPDLIAQIESSEHSEDDDSSHDE